MKIIITRKKIKNLILKINDNSEILISAPYYVSEVYINNFIKSKEDWIKKQLEVIKNKNNNNNLSYNNGEEFIFLGKKYNIISDISLISKCFIQNNNFYILSPDNLFNTKHKIVQDFIIKNLDFIFSDICSKLSQKVGLFPKSIKIRDMKSRWGSCNIKTKNITLNYRLYLKPIEAIEYVILHEICHLLYPHHQKSFWDFVAKFMPDYKIRKKILNKS
ncbi:M48 family metallopeptidase [Fusobacterium hominis]|nr:SprT family zinc-dependent metalloprotease [Fusobacterium hominis]